MPRSVCDIRGLENTRSMHTTGKRSIPRTAGSTYLDMYMLEKEKERLEKENAVIEKRKAVIQKRLDEVNKELKEGHQEKKLAKVTINY